MTSSSANEMSRPVKLSFLDLPAEIRLQIYPDLLHSFYTYKQADGTVRYFRDSCTIECSRKGADPHTLQRARKTTGHIKDEPLFPEILATCRTVHEEATPILYQDNTFSFGTNRLNLEFDDLPRNSKKICQNLMSYQIDEDDYDDAVGSKPAIPYTKIPSPIKKSTLAAFLRRIGPDNASLIRSLHLTCSNPYQAADDIILATHLCVFHTPGLQKLTLSVYTKEGIYWDESPDWYHPDSCSPFWCNGPFEPMYRALQRFVEKITWLRVLKYVRRMDMQIRFQDPYAMCKIGELEEFVAARGLSTRIPNDTERLWGRKL
ncbi:MAG: hypothetical protein LQ349_008418 [Xanthoria aureola]|nr:MAG: hypothetical protein LQ349_008418 [Xanthoria aureola]